MNDLIELGKTGIRISPVGLGTMQWGDVELANKYDENLDQEILNGFKLSCAKGITFFDTAEMYGNGRSEIFLGRCLKNYDQPVVVATKFMPFPWRLSRSELQAGLKKSLKRLNLPHVDLYQMHWPIPPVPIPTWMEAMADAIQEGLIKTVGVSNYSTEQMQLAYETLSKHGIPLASNQVRYSLLHRYPETSGLIKLCASLGVTVIAYSPLEKGILTGKFTIANPPKGRRAWVYNKSYLLKIAPLISKLKEIGNYHNGKTPAQVSLNWLTCKGAVPIPGARNAAQAAENAGALGWALSSDEIEILDNIRNEVL